MCSRFELNSTPREVAEAFDLSFPPALPNQSEARPTDRILTLTVRDKAELRQWGIPAPWDGSPIFNARSETVREKPTFRDYLGGRCLIPVSAWFEWRKDGKARIKTRIAPTDDGHIPFAFAGLCNAEFATILTASAIPSLSEIHGRMPIVLSPDDARRWLRHEGALDGLADLLKPRDFGKLSGTPVEKPLIDNNDARQGDLFG